MPATPAVPVTDQGRSHIAAEWGGTGFNFTISPDKPQKFWFEAYSRSADHFRDAVAKAGADVLIARYFRGSGIRGEVAWLSLHGQRPDARAR